MYSGQVVFTQLMELLLDTSSIPASDATAASMEWRLLPARSSLHGLRPTDVPRELAQHGSRWHRPKLYHAGLRGRIARRAPMPIASETGGSIRLTRS